MKILASQSGRFNPRILLAFALCSFGMVLGALSFAATPASPATAGAPTWTKVGSYQPPINRAGHVMARDRTGRTVVFGGSTPGSLVYVDDTWTFDGSRWIEHQLATRPLPRAYAMAAYDPVRMETVLFGGAGEFFSLADTWTWDGATWTQRTPAISPPARSFGGMAYDAATQKVILFGGAVDGGLAILGDTWSWDGTEWLPEPAVLSPPPRYSFGFADGSATSKPVLFGGALPFRGDTWIWDGLLHTWVPAAVTGPSPRAGVTMGYDPARGNVLLLGGYNNIPFMETYGDTWSWNGSAWTQLNPATSPSLTTRWGAALAYDAVDLRIRVVGGLSCTPFTGGCFGGYANDTWGWNGTTWKQEDLTAPQEMQNAMLADEPGPGAIMFGGQYEYGHYSQETWRWDGGGWRPLSPVHAPLPRGMAAMMYVPSTGTTLLFGGAVDTLGLPGPRQIFAAQDTWTWDGTDWTELFPATPPPSRSHASIAYDAIRGEVVLFGGATVLGDAQGDTWIWDGSTWTERQPPVSPPARFAGHMTYDPARGNVVLFGGSLSNNEGWFSDTWLWDGQTWTEVTPVGSPSERAYGGMGFDPSTASVILFGGCANCFANPVYDETWSWDGTSWTLLNTTDAPYRRTTFAMLDGNGEHPLLLFGGRRAALTPEGFLAQYPEGTEHTNDVWEFEGGLGPRPVSVLSRKRHGSVGAFDIDLPLTGDPGIESRQGQGANSDEHQVVLTFSAPASVASAACDGKPATTSTSGNDVTVNCTGVANAKVINVTLNGVTVGTTSGNLTVPMAVLVGDTTAGRAVNSSDISQTKSQSGQPVTTSNFRQDVTVNGSVNSSDISLVKSKSGTALP